MIGEGPPLWAEGVGWYGAAAILGAYALSSLGRLEIDRNPAHARLYQGLNLSGAAGVVVISAFHQNWQPLVLNAFWAGIALLALWRHRSLRETVPDTGRGAGEGERPGK